MKIVSYNLHFGGNKGTGNPWHRMLQEFGPDIVFAQETFDPVKYLSPEGMAGIKGRVWTNVPGRSWGSAILSRQHKLEPMLLPGFEGSVVGARLDSLSIGEVQQPAILCSLHAPSPGPYVPVVNRILDAIGREWSRTPLILAGDFNVTTALRHANEPGAPPPNSAGEQKLLTRLRMEFGLVNAWQVLHPNEYLLQTLRWNGKPSVPYHCDAIFVSHSLLPRLVSAGVSQGEAWDRMSDHNPIVAEFN